LREAFGPDPRLIDAPTGSTLRDVLETLASTDPDFVARLEAGLEDGYLNVLVNGRNARFLAGHDTRVKAGDVVAFLPPVGGG
jgi:MoaD family protein